MAITAGFHNGTYTATQVRRIILGGPMAAQATGVEPRQGVITGPANALLVAASSGMTVSIQPGFAIVAGYEVVIDAQDSKTLDPSTTTARWDVVGLRVYDQEAGDTAPSRAEIWVVKGTTTAEAPFPARFLPLSRVVVGASVASISSGNLTDRRTWTSAAGGTIPIPGALASTPTAAGVAVGQGVWDASAEAPLLAKSSTEWMRLNSVPTWSARVTPAGVIPAGGGNDFTIGNVSQAANQRLRVDLVVVVTRHTFDGGAVPTLRASVAVGVSGASWVAAEGEQLRVQGATTYAYQTTINGSFYVPAPASAITRSLRGSVWVDGGATTGSRVDVVRADVSPCTTVAGF